MTNNRQYEDSLGYISYHYNKTTNEIKGSEWQYRNTNNCLALNEINGSTGHGYKPMGIKQVLFVLYD